MFQIFDLHFQLEIQLVALPLYLLFEKFFFFFFFKKK